MQFALLVSNRNIPNRDNELQTQNMSNRRRSVEKFEKNEEHWR